MVAWRRYFSVQVNPISEQLLNLIYFTSNSNKIIKWRFIRHFQLKHHYLQSRRFFQMTYQPTKYPGQVQSTEVELGNMLTTQQNFNNANYPQQPRPYYPQQPPQYFQQPGPTPVQVYPPQPQNNANAFAACNEGLANGFGAMFFNVRDPNFTQTNVPIKQRPSMHVPVVVFNIIFLACLAVGIAGMNKFLDVGGMVGMIVGSYVVYAIVGCCCSDIRDYVHNTKRFDNYQETYNNMVRGQGFFRFWIECYHYVTVRTRRGTSRRKVVTHTATEIFRPIESVDESGEITSIQDVTSHVFLHYLKRFYFTDDASQGRFVAAFNSFVARNRRDVYQNYSHTFDITGFQEYVSFTALGDGTKSTAFFYIFTLLGLGFPYACIFERTVSRYDVGILKRLTT